MSASSVFNFRSKGTNPRPQDAEPIDFTAPWIREHYKDDVFIIVERGFANENGDGIIVPVQWASGPVTLKGIIDSATAMVDFELGVTVPLYGYTKLTALKGNLRNGVVGTYDIGAGSGMITLFHKGRDVWLDVSFKSVFARVDRSSYIVSLPKESPGLTDFEDFRPPRLQYRL